MPQKLFQQTKITSIPAAYVVAVAEHGQPVGAYNVEYSVFQSLIMGKTTVSIPANTSSYAIILGSDTIKGFNVSFLATRGSRYRKESIEILVGATGYVSAGALILPNGETETGGLTISHDTSGGNARLLITTDNADATATTFTYYLKSF